MRAGLLALACFVIFHIVTANHVRSSFSRFIGEETDMLNIRDFGAKGDGKADDAIAFQNVLNLVQDNIVVWIPNGTYTITGLKINRGIVGTISLIGEDPFTTVIRMNSNSSCSLAQSGCVMLWDLDSSYLVISTSTWDGNNIASSIFRSEGGGTGVTGVLSDVVFKNADYAIYSTSTAVKNCAEWQIMNCMFDKLTFGPCFSMVDNSSSEEGNLNYPITALVVLVVIVAVVAWLYQRKRRNQPAYLSSPFSFDSTSFSSLLENKFDSNENSTELEMTPTAKVIPKSAPQTIFTYSFAYGSLPSGISASGGQSGTAFNLAGLIIPTLTPRIDFGNNYFVSGDPARTNLVLQANSFSVAPWSPKTNGPSAAVQVTPNAGISPDSSKNASQLVVSASGSSNNVQAMVQQIVSGLTIGQLYTASVFVQGTKGGESLVLQIQTGDSPYNTLAYNGIKATTSWNQYSCTFLATSTSVYFGIGTNTSEVPLTSTPQSGGTLLIYGSQLEAGPTPSSFIPTLSTPVTRSSSLQRWFAPTSGLVVEPSRTNLVILSNSFNLPPWKPVSDGASVTITPNAGTSPSGQPCVKAVFSPISPSQPQIGAIQQLIGGLTSGATYQASVWVQGMSGGETFYLSIQLGTSPYTVLGYVLISAQPFWQRFSCSFVSPGSSVYIGIGGNTTEPPVLPTSGGSVFLFNAQVEQGAWPSSDIITSTSAVTRAADSLSFTIPSTVDTLNYTFSDGTVQSISVSPGTYTIPTNLNRAKITLIQASSTPSLPITSLTFGTPYKYLNGSPFKVVNGDTWSTTWADDDVIYTQSDDSYNVWAPNSETSNLCISTLSDTTLSLTGNIVNHMTIFGNEGQKGPDGATWKANGTICIDGVLYTFVSRQTYGIASNGYIQTALGCQLIKSSDHGATWTPLPPGQALPFVSPMFPTNAFATPEFIQYGGRDYQNNVVHNADQFVYAVSNDGSWNNGNYMILGRVGRSVIGNLNASDWQFYQGGDGSLPASWGPLSSAYKIVSGTKQCGLAGAQYIPFCKRYLILQWFYPSIITNGTDNTKDTQWRIYESPTPWGPWTLIQTWEWNQEPGLGLYNPNVMPKSVSGDNGQNIMVATCGDYWNVADYTLTLVPTKVNN